jgi:hypothetical protein
LKELKMKFASLDERFAAALRYYGLEAAWDLYTIHNTAYSAPYHNSVHAQMVVLDTILNIQSEFGNYPENRSNTRLSLCQLGAIAAIFHDVNHSAGSCYHISDVLNVSTASQFVRDNSISLGLLWDDLELICKAIDCTVYNGKEFPIAPDHVISRALRDADISTIFYSDVYPKVVKSQLQGIIKEVNLSDPEDVFKIFKTVTFYTPRGKYLSQHMDVHIKESLALVSESGETFKGDRRK